MIISWQSFTETHPLPYPTTDLTGAYTNGNDLAAILSLAARRRPERVCEIGTGYGDTARHLGKLLPDATIFTYDVCREYGGYDVKSRYTAREVRPLADVGRSFLADTESKNVVLYVQNGHKLPDVIKQQAPYHFVFIDGDHTWRRVVDDTKLALECAADDAVLVWDDYWYHCPEVGHFIDLFNERVFNLICHIVDTRVCFTPLTKETRARMLAEITDL